METVESKKEKRRKYYLANRAKILEYQRKNREENREGKRLYAKEHYAKNREKGKEYRRNRYKTYNREEQLAKRKKWYLENKERHAVNRATYEAKNKDRLRAARRKWENDKLATDINYRLRNALSGRIRFELKGKNKKSKITEELIGCSVEDLKVFLESQFEYGMTWDNWETNGWHIDHRIPISWFNLENENCRKLAFNYKNLQPLWGEDNLRKKNKYSHKMAL